MSYSITPDQRVLKDGEYVGFIRDSICYTDSPPKGRGVSTFRAMAGDSELQFKPLPAGAQWDELMAETRRKESVSQANNPIFSGDPERFTETISSVVVGGSIPASFPRTEANFEGLSIQIEGSRISSAAGVDNDSVMEPAASCDDLAAGNLPTTPEPPRSAVLGDRDPEWQRWYIATRGEDAFKAKWPNRQLP